MLDGTMEEVLVMRRYSRMSMVVAMALTGSSCEDSNAPSRAVAVRATLERTQYRAGESVSVPVEIENTGEGLVRIPGGSIVAFLEVRNAAGRVVFFGRSGTFVMSASGTRFLEPGERVTDKPVWSGQGVGPAADVTADPGTYRLRAAVAVGNKADYALSDPLDVTIVPNDSCHGRLAPQVAPTRLSDRGGTRSGTGSRSSTPHQLSRPATSRACSIVSTITCARPFVTMGTTGSRLRPGRCSAAATARHGPELVARSIPWRRSESARW